MAIIEVQVQRKEGLPDPVGNDVAAEASRVLGIQTSVKTAKIFRMEGLTPEQAQDIASAAFIDPIIEEGQIGTTEPRAVAFVGIAKDYVKIDAQSRKSIEVSFKPEMSEPVAEAVMEVARNLDIPLEAARVSTVFTFDSNITPQKAAEIAYRLLVNRNVQEIVNKKPETLKIKGETGPVKTVPIRESGDDALMALSKDKLFLNLEEMQIIRDYFVKIGRDPKDAELEHIAAAWSEHCVHKTFNAKVMVNGVEKDSLYGRIKDTSMEFAEECEVVTAFEDNSGGKRIYGGKVVLIKAETHNKPSTLDPYSGSATGIGGLIRDLMATGQGAFVFVGADIYVVGLMDTDPDSLPKETIPPDTLLRGIVAGNEGYGNPMGIPSANGSVHFSPDFAINPTILVGGCSVTEEKYAKKGHPEVGDRVVVFGGRTGRDGIHGATFSSGESTERTATVNSAAVQLGGPIEEKKFGDAIIEARDKGLIRAITDCGAAGFASSIGEMGSEIGVSVDISKAPLKYEGLAPWEIWLSESQERMTAAIDPEKVEEFIAVCKKYGVEATDLGVFDGSNKLKVTYGDEVVVDLDYDFLKNGLPQRVMEAEYVREVFEEPEFDIPTDWDGVLKQVMSHGNVCSKQPIVRKYDTTVQGGNALPPYGGVHFDAPNDAAVVTPDIDEKTAVILAHGINPILNKIDPARGAKWAFAEGMSNFIAAGGDIDRAVLCVNYVAPSVDKQVMGALDLMVDSICASQKVFRKSVVSGKDSLSSTYKWPDEHVTNISPVVNVMVVGDIPDVEKTISTDIKKEGTTLVMVGKRHPGMGGSTYYSTKNIIGNEVPDVDNETILDVGHAMRSGVEKDMILACHDISEGGLATAVAEMCFGGDCGIELTLETDERPDFYIFNETAGVFVVEVESPQRAKELFGDIPYTVIGRTKKDKTMSVKFNGQDLFESDLESVKSAWKQPMQKIFHAAA